MQVVTTEPSPPRAQVRLGLFEGDGQRTMDVVIPVLGSYVETVEPDHMVMVLFMGDTYESGVVMGRVEWF